MTDSFLNTILDGQYRIDTKIGSGGMAVVYRGTDLVSQKAVAIKMMRQEESVDPDMVHRFDAEEKALRMLQHPHIVRTFSSGESAGHRYIVMEYVNGETLKERIARAGHLSVGESVRYALQILDALAHSHSQGVLHRDIKPHNILLDLEGNAKLADFGLARASMKDTMTFAGQSVLGSVHYFSPEQAQGTATTAQTDIYSMGILLYEMVTGQLPFEGDSVVSVALKHLQEDPLAPSSICEEVPRSIEEIILKAIQKDPKLRYDTAEQMQQDLRRAMHEPEGGFVDLDGIYQKEETNVSAQENDTGTVSEKNYAKRRKIFRKKEKRLSLYLLVAMILLVGIFLALFLIGRNIFGNVKRTKVVMPAIVQLSLDDAKSVLDTRGLYPEIVYEFNDEVEEGKVIRQTPEAETLVEEEAFVQIVVSEGPEQLEMSNYCNMSFAEAEAALHRHGLVIGVITTDPSSSLPEGYIVSHCPHAGETIIAGSSVDIVVSGTIIPQ